MGRKNIHGLIVHYPGCPDDLGLVFYDDTGENRGWVVLWSDCGCDELDSGLRLYGQDEPFVVSTSRRLNAQ